jgi:hypothetical protein
MLALLLTLTGCASVQTVPVCPEIPDLSARVPLGPNYRDRMLDFLSGKLPEPTNSERP